MFLFSLDLSTRPWQFPSLRDLGFLCLIPEFFGGGADFSQQEKLDFSFLIPHFVRGEGSMEDKSVCPSFRYTCSMPFRTKLFLTMRILIRLVFNVLMTSKGFQGCVCARMKVRNGALEKLHPVLLFTRSSNAADSVLTQFFHHFFPTTFSGPAGQSGLSGRMDEFRVSTSCSLTHHHHHHHRHHHHYHHRHRHHHHHQHRHHLSLYFFFYSDLNRQGGPFSSPNCQEY